MKPFNIEHAKAGAPVRLSDGTELVRIIATDARGGYPVIALIGFSTHDAAQCFDAEGNPLVAYSGKGEPDWLPGVRLVMAPLGQVEGREVYMGDTLLQPSGDPYHVNTTLVPPGLTWPRKYPVTRMTPSEFAIHHSDEHSILQMFESVANAAIAHGIEHGYLAEPVHMASDHELMLAYYHPAPPIPMMPHSYDKMLEQLRRVRDTVFKKH